MIVYPACLHLYYPQPQPPTSPHSTLHAQPNPTSESTSTHHVRSAPTIHMSSRPRPSISNTCTTTSRRLVSRWRNRKQNHQVVFDCCCRVRGARRSSRGGGQGAAGAQNVGAILMKLDSSYIDSFVLISSCKICLSVDISEISPQQMLKCFGWQSRQCMI